MFSFSTRPQRKFSLMLASSCEPRKEEIGFRSIRTSWFHGLQGMMLIVLIILQYCSTMVDGVDGILEIIDQCYKVEIWGWIFCCSPVESLWHSTLRVWMVWACVDYVRRISIMVQIGSWWSSFPSTSLCEQLQWSTIVIGCRWLLSDMVSMINSASINHHSRSWCLLTN